jgi:hypothetical protein
VVDTGLVNLEVHDVYKAEFTEQRRSLNPKKTVGTKKSFDNDDVKLYALIVWFSRIPGSDQVPEK